jgi:mannose-6-phosphate isomerase-like protein (cupin superfamily)
MSSTDTRGRVSGPLLIRHEGHTPRERSACGWRDRLISQEDAPLSPAAWAHAVDIDGARLHYHKRSTELYYVLDGSGSVLLDGVVQPVSKGSLVHIPPGVVHGARGRMRVLVVGIPDIAEDDYFEALNHDSSRNAEPGAPADGGRDAG